MKLKLKNLTPHGRGVRGLNLSRSSVFFGGAFGRIFRSLAAAEFGESDKETEANLKSLGAAMVSTEDKPKDAPDGEESGIPALYTYLGQFIDHDITFDPASSLQQQNDPDGLVDYRTPKFDLDNVYGRGPDDQPYLYDFSAGSNRAKFLLGKSLGGGGPLNSNAKDLARNDSHVGPDQPARAIIGDPRNDENALVSQLQGLFLRFHNRLIDNDPNLKFADAQKILRYHYQWMLVHDFLVKLVNKETLHEVFPHLTKQSSLAKDPPFLAYFHPRDEAFMPLEFSVAAYRFGHSMVRPGYRLNDGSPDQTKDTLLPIFGEDGLATRPRSLRGFMAPDPNWALDWARFIDIQNRPNGVELDDNDRNKAADGKPLTEQQRKDNRERLQLAYRIDTSIVFPLGDLPPDVADLIIPSLASRNLIRGWRLRLPNGESVAKAMGIAPLPQIKIGKFQDQEESIDISQVPELDDKGKKTGKVVTAFQNNCPLWTYCLAETREHTVPGLFGVKSKLLGPVGGRIVAETFAGLLKFDSQSFLTQDPNWTPRIGDGKTFGLKDFVNFALGQGDNAKK